jgi:hypothetical protein
MGWAATPLSSSAASFSSSFLARSKANVDPSHIPEEWRILSGSILAKCFVASTNDETKKAKSEAEDLVSWSLLHDREVETGVEY